MSLSLSLMLRPTGRRSVGQSVLEWSTHMGFTIRFYYCLTVTGLLIWGVLSDERTGLPFIIAAGLASAVILGSQSLGSRDLLFLSQIRDFPLRRLLPLAGLRWRYSTPPPHEKLKVKIKVKFTMQLTVSHSVSLGVELHLGLMSRY
jgi:hypothetical protein